MILVLLFCDFTFIIISYYGNSNNNLNPLESNNLRQAEYIFMNLVL